MARIDLDDDAARRFLAAVLLQAANDAKRDAQAGRWLTESPQARGWLELIDLNPDRVPDLSKRTKKTRVSDGE
jgi:hypothetical protein